MNIANAIRFSVADKMYRRDSNIFTVGAYNQMVNELKAMKNAPYHIISVEDVQANNTHCYALFGDGSILFIHVGGKISALSVSGE